MCSSLMRDRGFIFTLDALLALMTVIGFSGALTMLLDQRIDLNRECLYQISQDAVEVCSKKADFSVACFDILKEVSGAHYSFFRNGYKEFGENGGAELTITRHYSGQEIELRVWG